MFTHMTLMVGETTLALSAYSPMSDRSLGCRIWFMGFAAAAKTPNRVVSGLG